MQPRHFTCRVDRLRPAGVRARSGPGSGCGRDPSLADAPLPILTSAHRQRRRHATGDSPALTSARQVRTGATRHTCPRGYTAGNITAQERKHRTSVYLQNLSICVCVFIVTVVSSDRNQEDCFVLFFLRHKTNKLFYIGKIHLNTPASHASQTGFTGQLQKTLKIL